MFNRGGEGLGGGGSDGFESFGNMSNDTNRNLSRTAMANMSNIPDTTNNPTRPEGAPNTAEAKTPEERARGIIAILDKLDEDNRLLKDKNRKLREKRADLERQYNEYLAKLDQHIERLRRTRDEYYNRQNNPTPPPTTSPDYEDPYDLYDNPQGGRVGERIDSGTSERASETLQRSKSNRGFRRFLAGVLVVAVGAATAAGFMHVKNNQEKPSSDNGPKIETKEHSQKLDAESPYEALKLGIYDGYNEKGMYTSKNKTSSVAFADAGEVAEVCDNDECEMLKYASHNQVETLADYLANLPEQLQPDGFKGLNLKDTEAKLETLSDDDFSILENQFRKIMDDAFTRRVVKNGTFDNAYMRHKGGDYVHDNMELVGCTTNESNLEVTEFYWTDDGTADGNVIGVMDVKIIPVRDSNGSIIGFRGCMQVINPTGSPIYANLPKITLDNPSQDNSKSTSTTPAQNPTNPNPGTTQSSDKPKDSENMTRIDKQINEDISKNTGGGQVRVNKSNKVSNKNKTDKPGKSSHHGNSQKTNKNKSADKAAPVAGSVSSPNNYSTNQGGSHSGEHAPVKENHEAQKQADKKEIPINEAPTGGQELQNVLGDLGIN